jgi:hypothetical protein
MNTPRPRPGESPQQQGRTFEKFWARVFGVQPTKGSGNQWFAKMDVSDGAVMWSCKHTGADSAPISKALFREVEEAITGPGGVGGEIIPGLATSLSGEVFVTLRAEDFLRIIGSDQARYLVPSKAEQKRARSRVPSLLREDEDGS